MITKNMKNYLVACLLCCGGAAVTSCTDYDDLRRCRSHQLH